MTTHFITAEIDIQESPTQLNQAIEAELKKRGEPLRWAITSIDSEQQKAHVEAVVTVEETSKVWWLIVNFSKIVPPNLLCLGPIRLF